MKNIFLFCIVLGLVFHCSAQQMTVKTGALVVSPNTNFYFAGLTLTPSATFTISNTTLSRDTVTSDTFANTYVSRTYRFSDTPVFSGTILINYLDAELNGLADSSLEVGSYNGSSFQALGSSIVNTIDNYVLTSGISSYPLRELILTTGVALPLGLVSISAIRQGTVVTVKWETAQEYHVKHYDVQRSTDGIRWATAISGVPAKNVPYSSNYQVMDAPGFDGQLFYRVRQVDISGATFLSNVVSVAGHNTSGQAIIMPNPAKDNFIILGIDQKNIVAVDILNSASHLVRHWHQSQNTYDLTSLSTGVYYVRIKTANKTIIHKQIIVR
ncbi:MAG: T9SS type A sorting domain-containing protein [Taibaiella sp.]